MVIAQDVALKLSVAQTEILQALALVSSAVPSRTTLPVLSNILLETAEGSIQIVADNGGELLAILLAAEADFELVRALKVVGCEAGVGRVDVQPGLRVRCQVDEHIGQFDIGPRLAGGATDQRPQPR